MSWTDYSAWQNKGKNWNKGGEMKGFIEITSVVSQTENKGKKIKTLKNVSKIVNIIRVADLNNEIPTEFPDANTLLEIDRRAEEFSVLCVETYEEIKQKIKEASE